MQVKMLQVYSVGGTAVAGEKCCRSSSWKVLLMQV